MQGFKYWEEDLRGEHLLAILTAQQVSINFAAFGQDILINKVSNQAANACVTTKANTYDIEAAHVTHATVDMYAAYAAAYAYHTIKSDKKRGYEEASLMQEKSFVVNAAIRSIKDSTNDIIDVEKDIESDLKAIKSKWSFISGIKKPDLLDFLFSPLWTSNTAEDWNLLHSQFNKSLVDLNEGFSVWIQWYKDRVNGVPLKQEIEQKWLDIPYEIRSQGAKALNAYQAALKEKKPKPLNLVRAIFIGSGESGKTSLIRKIKGESVLEGEEKMTPGIEIREWSVPKTKIKARFWDFGGQVMSHSTHQFFLREHCLYILVIDARTEINANDQAEYWLEHVKAFGNNAPVMLVGNKSDLTAVNLDMNALNDKYPNIVSFYPISCVSKTKHHNNCYRIFHDDLIDRLKKSSTSQVKFTRNQFEVLKQVRKLSQNNTFLKHNEFTKLCKKYEISKTGFSQQSFLEILDSLGEIIYFPDLDWEEDYILNPRWLTYGVYTLLYSGKANKQQGELSEADVVSILHNKVVKDENGNKLTYPKTKCRFIIDAMSSFKLCYRLLDDATRFVIPDKLLPDQPNNLNNYFNKERKGTLSFEFEFQGLLPRNVMPNIIVARHKEIVIKQKKQLVWQNGVLIQNNTYQCKARIQVDYHRRILQLWIQGEEPREYLAILRDEIYKILDVIKGLSVEENVVLPFSARIDKSNFKGSDWKEERATYKSLIEEAKLNRDITVSDAGNQYDLKKILGFIMTKKQQKKEGLNIINNNIQNLGSLSIGDDNNVTGKVVLNTSERKSIVELKDLMTCLMKHIQNYDIDFEIKSDAHAELKQIREQLNNIENVTPEARNKLIQVLTNIKDGTLKAIKLGQEIKEANEVTNWLMEKAIFVSALLAGFN